MIRRLFDRFGFADPETSPWPCRCDCPAIEHTHYRAGSDCGTCGPSTLDNPDGCDTYRPNRDACDVVDLQAVCASDEVIDAVHRDDIDTALDLADPTFVALLAALRDTGRHP